MPDAQSPHVVVVWKLGTWDAGSGIVLVTRTRFKITKSLIFQDEVEKLAYQLNEEAERTERPIRRLSKVMYGSTCADMQVDVMGECLSSIKHVVGVRSVFLAKRLHAV
ncbi:uncharacterized protein TNCV_1307201 [Trichonephila clavipes]|nr:uncharacterized protein TNCV_1307201 [Trichonephila clavipes]